MTTGDGDSGSIRAGFDPDDPLYTPMPRVIRIRNGQDLTVKWCETCRIYRPPRSSHCRICDNCVDLIDHHCIYLNTCIARRNYVPFWAFLSYSILTSFFILVTCAVHLYLVTLPTSDPLPVNGSFGGGQDFEGALRDSPVSALLFLLLIGALIPVCMLFRYHLRIVALGRTTAEEVSQMRWKGSPLAICD
jgi:palmitoyltransferase ZDHHC9/14/18